MYGKSIGRKFEKDGSVRRYPGNTIIADVNPGCSAYDVMVQLRKMVIDAGFDDSMILLPEDSYHMTVIQGLNDQVRTDEYWPALLPKDTPMQGVDDHVTAAIASVQMPGAIRMKFREVRVNEMCFYLKLRAADEAQEQVLRAFRDAAAEAIGVYLPRHNEYGFHITLAYTRVIAEGEQAEQLQALLDEMNQYIANQPAFETTPPYVAYYDDMLRFSPTRIPRDK